MIGCLLTCEYGTGAGCEPVRAKLCARSGAGVHYVPAAWTASSCTGESQMAAPAPALWVRPPAPPGLHYSLSAEASTSGTPATPWSLTDINCNLHRKCISNIATACLYFSHDQDGWYICKISNTYWCTHDLCSAHKELRQSSTSVKRLKQWQTAKQKSILQHALVWRFCCMLCCIWLLLTEAC